MDPKAACLAQAEACCEKAQADPANRDYWIDRSIIWLDRAFERGRSAATSEFKQGGLSRLN
jgi:hypothetical protein